MSDDSLGAGSELAGYRIERLIARGGMGEVYEATQLSLGRRVALKRLSASLAADEGFRERFRREARAAASIRHPHILQIHEAGELPGGSLFIAMYLIDGPDLSRYLDEHGPLAPAELIEILEPIASALDAAHAKGLVHRDVKPANILLEPRDDGGWFPYLADFGLAKPLEDAPAGLTRSGQFVGTIEYMAPEQITNRHVDGRADVYAFGAVIYRCITGTVPYVRETSAATLLAHINADVPVPSETVTATPRALDDLVQRCMAKDPENRASSAVEAIRTAAAQLGEGPLSRRPTVLAGRDSATEPAATTPVPRSRLPTVLAGEELPERVVDSAPAPRPQRRPPRKRLALLGLALIPVAAAGVVVAIALSGAHHAQAATAASLHNTHTGVTRPPATSVSLTHPLAGPSGQAYCVEQVLTPTTGTLSRQQAEALCSCDVSKERAAGFHTFEQVGAANAAGDPRVAVIHQSCAARAPAGTPATTASTAPTPTTAVTVTHTAVTTTSAIPNTNAKPLDAVYCDQNDQRCADVLSSGMPSVPGPPSGYDAAKNCYWVNEGYNASLGFTKHFCFPPT